MRRTPALAWGLVGLGLIALGPGSGCAYPRRATPLQAVSPELARTAEPPEHMWRFVLVRADIPPQKRSGLPWDDDGKPDPYLKLVVDGRKVWESPKLENELHPRFDASPPYNLALDRHKRIRLELWDADGMAADPIGIYEGRALGDAIVGANTTIKLEGGATVTVRVEPPQPHQGTGIALYEVRKNALVVLKVVPNSPAARAGLSAGDRITAVNGKLVDHFEPGQAESALALAAQQASELTVERDGNYRRVTLDGGYVWLSM
jgi:hypothetical protein